MTAGAFVSPPADGWWTEAEIAAARLRAMPATQRGVHELIRRAGWRDASPRAERRGGGWVYHEALFPPEAQADIAARRAIADAPVAGRATKRLDHEALWRRFARITEAARQAAQRRAAIAERVERLVAGGAAASEAVRMVATLEEVSAASIWRWRVAVDGVRRDWWAPILADGRAVAVLEGGKPGRSSPSADVAEEAWNAFLADFLRPTGAPLSDCWRRTDALAQAKGWAWPCERTVRRKVQREIPPGVLKLSREGREALKRMYPAQSRDRSDLHAMACVNADGHKLDLFARWEDERIGRPILIAFQDVYSGKVLSWRLDRTENVVPVLLALGDMVEDWGVPDDAVLDNGRQFASKMITGGVGNRYRFKVRVDEPSGVFTQLGVRVHWTHPYSGQSKPIERAFRDLSTTISQHPAFDGAYTGKTPDAKPEDYGSRAIPIAEVERIVAVEIAAHNAREGRRGGLCAGRSFDQVFAESYAQVPIRRVTEDQRRLWLLGAESLRAHTESGTVSFLENQYWSEALSPQIAGRRIVGRFDPLDLGAGLHVYTLEGIYLGHLPCMAKGRFLSLPDAKNHARARKAFIRAVRDQAEALKAMDAAELAALHAGLAPPEETKPARKVVRPMFGGSDGAARAAAAMAWAEDDEPIDVATAQAMHDQGIRLIYGGAPPGGSPA